MKKILIIILVLAIILGVGFWRFGYLLTRGEISEGPITIKVWGLWEEQNLMKGAIEEFEKQNPNIKIEYNYQSTTNYRNRVQTQVSQGENGPDIFMIHNTWLPMFQGNLATIPSDIMSFSEFQNTFYQVAIDSLSGNGLIYALPVEVDGLGLYYNQEILEREGVSIPKDWFEFRNVAKKLTKLDSQGNVEQAGAALGTTSNVDHWPDIIGLLFSQQPEADLEKPASPALSDPTKFPGVEVISFYTNFVLNPKYKSWDQKLESSTQAFYSGKLAFYFAPSWRAHEIKEANQGLKFKIAPVPQLSGGNTAWGTFWAFAVSSRSANQKEAWQFLKFLTSKETVQRLYQDASTIRLFGEPYSRKDLASSLLADPYVGSFISQAPAYKSWYLASRTFDGVDGINSRIIKYYEDAINLSLGGGDALGALQTTEQGVQQVLEEYRNPTQVNPSP